MAEEHRSRQTAVVRDSRRAPLRSFELVLIALMFGLLAAANGVSFSFNSAIPCGLLAIALLAWRVFTRDFPRRLTAYAWAISLVLATWFLGAAASTAVHLSQETLASLYAGYLIPLTIYLGLVNRELEASDKSIILAAVAAGSMLPCAWGIAAYFAAFGIPNPLDLFWNRYDLERMASYQRVAFGNTSHMALYIAMVLPPTLVMATSRTVRASARILFVVASLLAFANMLLIFSRGAMVTMVLLLAFWTIVFRSIRLVAVMVTMVSLFAVLVIDVGDISEVLFERTLGVVSDDDVVDPSVSGRLGSMAVGWRIFAENPFFGVGPGLTYRFNEWSIAHQLIVEEAASIGILGLLATLGLTLIVGIRCIQIIAYRPLITLVDMALWSGVLGWTIYTVLAGGLLHLGLLIPWAGLLYGFLALGLPTPAGAATKVHGSLLVATEPTPPK
jgi:O-antigen ligase